MQRNRMLRVAAAVVCCVFLVAFLVPRINAKEVTRHGYSLLKNDNQRLAYEAIVQGIGSLNTEISIAIPGVTNENQAGFQDVQYAEAMVSKDYPEFFWYHGAYSLQSDGSCVVFIPSGYSVNGQQVGAGSAQLAAAQAQMDAAVAEALARLPANPSDYEIAHTIHDYVVEKVEYVQTGDHQTAYGALGCGKAVCAGYARAYQLLMNKAGIPCWYVAGESYAPNGERVGHAWNLVWLDGMCYYSDVTWDDQGSELFHEYLNMSLEEISKTHFTTDPLPAPCGHDTYTFFRMSDGKGVCDIRDHKNAAEVADCFLLKSQEGTEAVYYCTIHYHGDDFNTWITGSIASIAQALGYTGTYRYQIIELGHEHHVTLTGQVSEALIPPQPTESTTSTEVTEAPTQSTEGTQSTETPTQPSEENRATQPPVQATENSTQSTEATEGTVPAQTTEPSQGTETEPTDTPTSQPDESTGDTQTEPDPSEPPQTQDGNGNVNSSTAGSGGQTVPSGTDDHQQGSGNGKEDDGNMTGILIGAAVVLVAGGAMVAVLILKKKKNT